jgi:hypothetical protein
MSRARELLAALMHANIGGFLTQPPGLDGDPGLGLVAVHGVPRARTWDAVASARAPALPGGEVTFVVLPDTTIVVEEGVPDDSLAPLAEAVEQTLQPPYRAAALRHESGVWAVVAERVEIVELPDVESDIVDLTVVDGERSLTIGHERTIRPLPALDVMVEVRGDVALHAERVDGDLFAVDVFSI